MISIQIKRKALVAVAAVFMFGSFSVASSAALISQDSELSFIGEAGADNGILNLAHQLFFPQLAFIIGATGDFAAASGGMAAFNTITFDPATPGSVLSFGDVPTTAASRGFEVSGGFTATSLTVDFQTDEGLGLTMLGYWSLVGFDDTPGELVLTADSISRGGNLTFSASGTVSAVPVPAALWLLGSALAGLGLTRRRT